MKSKHLFLTQLLCSFLGIANASAQQTNEQQWLNEAKIAISNSNAIYFKAFVSGDSSVFIDRYAEDCCIMAPNLPALCQKNAAGEFFRMAYTQVGIRNGRFTTTELFGNGKDFVTESGLFELYDGNNNIIDTGKYLVLWKKTANGWKMFRDSFSSNNPIR